MGVIRDLGRFAFRLYNTDGVPASGPHYPDKDDIFEFIDALDAAFVVADPQVGRINAHDYFDMEGEAGDGEALQEALDAAEVLEWLLEMRAGTALIDVAQATSGGQLFGLGNDDGAGKKYVIHGDNRRLVTLLGTDVPEYDFLTRWAGISDDPIIIDMRRLTLNIGDCLSTRPMVSLRNAVLEMQDLLLVGNHDAGGGISGQRFTSGTLRNIIIRNACNSGYSFGPGLSSGENLGLNNHPIELHLHACQNHSPKGNGFNLLGAENSTVNQHYARVDVAKYGYLGTYNAERVGNGCRNIQVNDGLSIGFWRGLRIVDVDGGSFVGNSHRLCGAVALLIREKDTLCRDLKIVAGFDLDSCRGVGRAKPINDAAADEDDDDDLGSVSNRSCYIILGGDNVSLTGLGIASDVRSFAPGRIVTTSGSTTATVVDDLFRGKNYAGLSRHKPGDMLYRGSGSENKPAFNARISQIGTRTFYDDVNGAGSIVGTAAYGGPMLELDGITPLLLNDGWSMTQTITFDHGAFLTQGDIGTLGDAGEQTGEPFRIRHLEETEIDIAISTPMEAIVPLRDPFYFNPLNTLTDPIHATTVTVSTGSPNVSGGAGSAFETWISPTIGDSDMLLLGLVGGNKVMLGKIDSVTDDDTLVLTANGLRNYTGIAWVTIENKMKFGVTIGERARNIKPDWTLPIKGYADQPWHVEPECIEPSHLPKREIDIAAQTVTTSDGVDVATMRPIFDVGRQRLWDIPITLKSAIVGDAGNYVGLRVQRIRDGTRTTITGMDVAVTDVDHAAGDVVTIPGPVSVSDAIPDADLIEPGDLIAINAYATGTGGAIPDASGPVPMVGW